MKRGKPLRRTGFKPKRNRLSFSPTVPKALGNRLTGKLDHRRSKKHKTLLHAQPCIVSGYIGPEVVMHHPYELVPGSGSRGRKISDFLGVPLRHQLHDQATPGSLHHSGASEVWWEEHGWPAVRVLGWLIAFLRRHYKPGEHPGADEALEAALGRRAQLLENTRRD